MGLFRKKRGERVDPQPPNVSAGWKSELTWLEWDPPCNWIAGESRYPEAFAQLAGEPRDDGYLVPVEVLLEREPQNSFDENAIVASVAGLKVGYISRDVAAAVAPALDRAGAASIVVCGIIRGGYTPRPNFGVHIWLDKHPQPSVQIGLTTDGVGQVGAWPPDEDEVDAALVLA